MPKLSIIIPIYNAENDLNQCIDSILLQSYKDFEILLINDGSTDSSLIKCEKYAAENPFIHTFHKANGGVSSARNLGIQLAKGEYIIFIDSDDWLEEEALSHLMEQKQIADLTFFGSTFHLPNKKCLIYQPETRTYHNFHEIQEGIMTLITNCKHPDYLGFTWNKVFNSSIIKEYQIRFTEKLSYREDEIFTLQYACHCTTMTTLPYLIYHYKISNTGLTKKKRTISDFLLLSHSYKEVIIKYTNKAVHEYIQTQIIKYSLDVIKRTSNLKIRNKFIDELWNHKKNINYSQLHMKSIYKYLLYQSSTTPIKLYMYCKLLFKTYN